MGEGLVSSGESCPDGVVEDVHGQPMRRISERPGSLNDRG
jgi:hypothetical protein